MEHKVAVVILNWNGEKFLKKFLPKIVENTSGAAKIFIIDNASEDHSIAFLEEDFPDIERIILDKNYGFTGGYNIGLRKIEAEYYALLNSDLEVPPMWIDTLIEYLDKHPKIACASPKIKSFDQKDAYEYAGAAGGYIDRMGYPFCRGRILSKIEKDHHQYDDIKDIFWASGACMIIRSEIFKEMNGFDEDFFAHMEEIDLCWRIKNAGYDVVSIPQSEVYHVGGGSLPNNSPHKLYLNYRNNLYLLLKNIHKKGLIFTLGVRFILDILSALIFLFSFRFGFAKAVLHAHISFWKNFSKMFQKRKKQRQKLPMKKLKGVYLRSIVLDFFIFRKKKFSQLNFKDME